MALLDRLFEKAIIKRFPEAKSYRAHQARTSCSPNGRQQTSQKKAGQKKPTQSNDG